MTTPLKSMPTSPEHEAFRLAFLALIDRHLGALGGDRVLAIASFAVGQLVALQDQRKLTPQAAIELVIANMEAGNQSVVDSLLNVTGGRA